MCKCNPEIRTPFCGKLGCEWEKPEGTRKTITIGEAIKEREACQTVTDTAEKLFRELAKKEVKEGLSKEERVRMQRLHDIIVYGRELLLEGRDEV